MAIKVTNRCLATRSRHAAALLAVALGMVAVGCAAQAAEGETMPFTCTAEGTELLAPGFTEAAACNQFAASLERVQGQLAGYSETPQNVEVLLRFTRNGVARAEVRRKGESDLLFDASYARSDRPLDPTAIDRLAHRVAVGFQVRYD